MDDYRKQAEYLIDTVSDLQRQVLVKHTAAILEEMHDQIKMRDAQIQRLTSKYGELLLAVAQKFPGETRHETALRYILERENQSNLSANSEVSGE